MPYALTPERLDFYQKIFIAPEYDVKALPGYDAKTGSNPLRAFSAIPLESRYRFLLEEAEFTLMGFIKGPVCRGNVALNAIQDRFWVFFVAPDVEWLTEQTALLDEVKYWLDLPAEGGSTAWPTTWFGYGDEHEKYLAKKNDLYTRLAQQKKALGVKDVWNGGGENSNAALTVLRHYDSATVVRGLIGTEPKTVWLIDYPQLERLHYLLVAGFDVFGNVIHQASTRLYMEYLRMEAEYNFLLLLPVEERKRLVRHWYRGVDHDVEDRVYSEVASLSAKALERYATTQPKRELLRRLEQRVAAVRTKRRDVPEIPAESLRESSQQLAAIRGGAASLLPEVSFVRVTRGAEVAHLSLLRDSAYTNLTRLFDETDRRLPEEHELTVATGFVGAYPNQLFAVSAAELPEFVEQISAMKNEADFERLLARFAVSRVSEGFWQYVDQLHEARPGSIEPGSGLLDLNRLAPH
jgi:hypothetical protein